MAAGHLKKGIDMKFIKPILSVALLAAATSAFAAKPTSIVFDANGETEDGTPFAQYAVKCSNGKKVQMTAWDNRREWCLGQESRENCEKKQIRAAKAACKAS